MILSARFLQQTEVFRPRTRTSETWCIVRNCDRPLTTDEIMPIVGIEREEIENKYAGSLIEKSTSECNGLFVEYPERDKDQLRMVIDRRNIKSQLLKPPLQNGKCQTSPSFPRSCQNLGKLAMEEHGSPRSLFSDWKMGSQRCRYIRKLYCCSGYCYVHFWS